MHLSGPCGVISVSFAVLNLAVAFIHKQRRPVIPPTTQYIQNTVNVARFNNYQIRGPPNEQFSDSNEACSVLEAEQTNKQTFRIKTE